MLVLNLHIYCKLNITNGDSNNVHIFKSLYKTISIEFAFENK